MEYDHHQTCEVLSIRKCPPSPGPYIYCHTYTYSSVVLCDYWSTINTHSLQHHSPLCVTVHSSHCQLVPVHCHSQRPVPVHCHSQQPVPVHCHSQRPVPVHCHSQQPVPVHCHSQRPVPVHCHSQRPVPVHCHSQRPVPVPSSWSGVGWWAPHKLYIHVCNYPPLTAGMCIYCDQL